MTDKATPTERDYAEHDFDFAATLLDQGIDDGETYKTLYERLQAMATLIAADRVEERKHHEWESLLAEALAQDWPLSRVSLYDEEGVEGWQLIGTDWGQEWSWVGDWADRGWLDASDETIRAVRKALKGADK